MKATDFDNLDLLPADFSYRNMDLELDDAKKRTHRLDQLLSGVADERRLLNLQRRRTDDPTVQHDVHRVAELLQGDRPQ